MVLQKQQIKGEEDQVRCLAAFHGRLQIGEIGDAVLANEADFAIDDAVVEAAGSSRQFWE